MAEQIEMGARQCVEHREEPDELLPLVVGLRTLFDVSLSALEKETNPLVERSQSDMREPATAGHAFGHF